MGRAMGDGYKLHQRRFHLNVKETFNNGNNQSFTGTTFPGTGLHRWRVPHASGQGVRGSLWASLPRKHWRKLSFKVHS